jgi:hypothetical protein
MEGNNLKEDTVMFGHYEVQERIILQGEDVIIRFSILF